ncbi:MAG: protein translocase subunit SecF [ANME-2 cluster archaeon]|nr:protein translocase subunit SecF [ANME-2 cluster archaeon]
MVFARDQCVTFNAVLLMETKDIDSYIDSYLGRFSTNQMIGIPLVIFFISLLILGWSVYAHGSPVELGVEFTGGTVLTVVSESSYKTVQEEFTSRFAETPPYSARDAGGGRVMLQFGPMNEAQQTQLNNYISSTYGKDVALKQMSAVYGENLQRSAVKAVLYAFLGMAVIVFLIFKSPVPSAAVVLSAGSDIIIAATLMDLFGIALSLGTVAALLMLIGYSVDSDILLTTRLLKRRGDTDEKIRAAMKTGLTMTLTTIAAVLVLFVVSTFAGLISSYSRIDIISDISIVLIFGLITDLMNTWMLNTGILKWYLARGTADKKGKRGRKR